jgi:predicted Rossmann fold nucleotide-binding protein DprA/Smf involved in DNA uptake
LRQFGSYAAVVEAAAGRGGWRGALPHDLRARLAETIASGRHRAAHATARRAGARFAVPGEPDYPELLAGIARPPIGIFV